MTTEAPPRPCPRCGSTEAVRILYGYPSEEMFDASARGEIALGGCLIGDEAPDYQCRSCGVALPWVAPDDELSGDDDFA